MKIQILADTHGNVLGTLRDPNTPGVQFKFRPRDGHKVHHIELPKELEEVTDAEELHKRLRKHLP